MIAVVHLVWGPLGAGPLQEFLASYKRHPAGAEHELVVLLNNVPDPLPAEFQASSRASSIACCALPSRFRTSPRTLTRPPISSTGGCAF